MGAAPTGPLWSVPLSSRLFIEKESQAQATWRAAGGLDSTLDLLEREKEMGMEGWWVRELELHLDSVHLRSSAFSVTPAMLLKIKGGKAFIIRQVWMGPFLLTLINATKLGRLLTLSKVQLSHQLLSLELAFPHSIIVNTTH